VRKELGLRVGSLTAVRLVPRSGLGAAGRDLALPQRRGQCHLATDRARHGWGGRSLAGRWRLPVV